MFALLLLCVFPFVRFIVYSTSASATHRIKQNKTKSDKLKFKIRKKNNVKLSSLINCTGELSAGIYRAPAAKWWLLPEHFARRFGKYAYIVHNKSDIFRERYTFASGRSRFKPTRFFPELHRSFSRESDAEGGAYSIHCRHKTPWFILGFPSLPRAPLCPRDF